MSIECNTLSTEGVCNRLSSSVLSMSHACLLDVTDCLLKVCGIDCPLNVIDCLLNVCGIDCRLSMSHACLSNRIDSRLKVCAIDCL